MKERRTITKGIKFTEKWVEKIQGIADQYNVSFSDIVRDCIENDFEKLKERYKARKKAGKQVWEK